MEGVKGSKCLRILATIPSARLRYFRTSRCHGGQTLRIFHICHGPTSPVTLWPRKGYPQAQAQAILPIKTSWITVPWTSSIDDHLRRAIQVGAIFDWFEVIGDLDNRPDKELWEDWM